MRVSYTTPERNMWTADIVPYLFWIPVEAVDARSFGLELYDETRGEVALFRRVLVKLD